MAAVSRLGFRGLGLEGLGFMRMFVGLCAGLAMYL